MTLRLAVATVRARLGSFVGAFVALMCAAALLTACGALLETGLSGKVDTERYASSPLVVAADQSLHFTKSNGKVKAKPLTEHAWLDQDLVRRVRGVPGGRGAVGELTFVANIVTTSGDVLGGPRESPSWGHAWSSAVLAPFTLAAGHPPVAGDEVVLDARLAATARLRVGSRTTIQSAYGRRTYQVAGVTNESLADQATVFFAERTARRLSGHTGQVYAIGLPQSSTADAGAVRAALAGTTAEVDSGSARGLVEFTDAGRAKTTLISVSGVLAATSALVAIVVVSGTFALSIGQRRRELALLRAIAATPRQIRRMIGREAQVVALLAGIPGIVLGLFTASWLRSRFVAFGVMPDDMSLELSPIPVVAALVLTVVSAWVAARVCAGRTARIHPTQALGEAAIESRSLPMVRVTAGLVVLSGWLVLLGVLSHLDTDASSRPVSLITAVLAVMSIGLLGPVLARVSSVVLSLPLRVVAPRLGHLAAANNRTGAGRTSSLMTSIGLAVTITASVVFTQTTLQHAALEQRIAGTLADSVIVPSDGPGIPADVVGAVQHAPGVVASTAELTTLIRIGQDKYPATGVTSDGLDETLDPGVRAGSLAHLDPRDLALSTRAADQHDLHLGDRVTVTLGDGTQARMDLAATYTRDLGFGDALLPFRLVSAHVDDPLAQQVLVRNQRASGRGAGLGRVDGMTTAGIDELGDASSTATGNAADIVYVAMGLVIAFTAIAILNSLALSVVGRRRELSTLRLAGLKKREVTTMIVLETFATTATAAILGAAVSAGILTAYAHGMTPGYLPHAPLWVCGVMAGALLALVTLAAVLPSHYVLRANPADAISEQS